MWEVEVQKLEGYVTVPQAAAMLGMTKQGLHKTLFQHGDSGPFSSEDLLDVGGDSKPMYLVRVDAVERVRQERAVRAAGKLEKSTGVRVVDTGDLNSSVPHQRSAG